MSDAEQIGFDIEFDDKTQAWLDRIEPARMNLAVRTFLAETLNPEEEATDETVWRTPDLSSADVVCEFE